ncbi:hypothetical protein [Oceanirhabdus seepicola]|uniref:Uncharacterized protein n=1 Tax=Oceanirhabdus seepicola TaxID=2828781 RepID=A0A9J6NXZ4_9CLOT|nr:hypothetical protein [Oceanirhabdus seepicola]MCM1989322.1 hypothetical protein [Oceanirhabdus seepicola]
MAFEISQCTNGITSTLELCGDCIVEPQICLLPPAFVDNVHVSLSASAGLNSATIEFQGGGVLCISGKIEKYLTYTGVDQNNSHTLVNSTFQIPYQCCFHDCEIGTQTVEIAAVEPVHGCYRLFGRLSRTGVTTDLAYCLKEKDIVRVRVRLPRQI